MKLVHPEDPRQKANGHGKRLTIVLILVAVSLCMDSYGLVDRLRLWKAQQATIEKLEARAEIQVILYRALKENRPITPDEDRRILQLWGTADFSRVK